MQVVCKLIRCVILYLVLYVGFCSTYAATAPYNEVIRGFEYPDRIPLPTAVGRAIAILQDGGKKEAATILQEAENVYRERRLSLMLGLCQRTQSDRPDFDHIALGHAVNEVISQSYQVLADALDDALKEESSARIQEVESAISKARLRSRDMLTDYAAAYDHTGRSEVAKIIKGHCRMLRHKSERQKGTT